VPWEIKLSSKAEKYYKKLDNVTRKRTTEALKELAAFANPVEHHDVKPLTGDLRGFYRLRLGDYRIVFAILRGIQTIAVVNFAPRGDVYK
jgi:mRNA interferase RelE/StbE